MKNIKVIIATVVALAIGNEVLSLLVILCWAMYGLYKFFSAAAEMKY